MAAQSHKLWRDYQSWANMTGKNLYAVPTGDPYSPINALTEDGTRDGLYSRSSLAGGVYDIWSDESGGTLIQSGVFHALPDAIVLSSSFPADQVDAAAMANDAIESAAIADDAVLSAHIADNQILANHIAAGQVGQSEIGTDAVGTPELIDGNVTTAKLADNSVTADKVAAGQINSVHIATDAVTQNEIADDAVLGNHIADNVILANHIAAGQVTQSALATDSVGRPEIQAGAVGTDEIEDLRVTNAKLANSVVTAAKIAAEAVTSEKLFGKAVTTAKIAERAVTAAKIAVAAIAAEHIQAKAIDAALIADRAVGAAMLQLKAITGAHLADATIPQEKLAAASVGTAQLVDSSVTGDKIANDAVTQNHISNALDQYIRAVAGVVSGTITNYPDDSTIESFDDGGVDKLRLKDGGISSAKLATAIQDELSARAVVYVAANDSDAEAKTIAGTSNTCDGTDDELVINPLIVDDTVVVLLPGTYNIDVGTPTSATTAGCIHVEGKSNFALIALKGASLIKESTVGNNYGIKLFECTRATLQIHELDGNKASAGGGGIQLANCDDVLTRETWIHDCAIHGFAFHSTRRSILRDSWLEDFDAAHVIDFNDDEEDNPNVSNEDCIVRDNFVDLGSGGGLDCLKLEDCTRITVSGNHFKSYAGASNLVIGGDVGDEAESTAWLNVHDNVFEGGDSSLILLRFGDVHVHHNFFSNKIQFGGGGGGNILFESNVIEQPDVNSALVIFAEETTGHRIIIRGNEIKSPDTATESKVISLTHDGVSTNYRVIIENNYIWNYRALGLEIDADYDLQPIIRNNIFEPSSTGANPRGVTALNAAGAVIVGNEFRGCVRSVILNAAQNCVVKDNIIDPHASATAGIEEESTANNNVISHNHFTGTGLTNLEYVKTLGADTIVEFNTGKGDIKTEYEGSVTVLNGTTNVVIDVGRDLASGAETRFAVWFASDPGSASKLWLTYEDVDDIRVRVDADPGVNVVVGYRATRLHPYFV